MNVPHERICPACGSYMEWCKNHYECPECGFVGGILFRWLKIGGLIFLLLGVILYFSLLS